MNESEIRERYEKEKTHLFSLGAFCTRLYYAKIA